MSVDHTRPGLVAALPMDRIAEICRRYGVSELSVYEPSPEGDVRGDAETLFLVMFRDDDFGPWGSKLDELEDDLSGIMHGKVHVAARQGIEHSMLPPKRDLILGPARRIYES